MLTPEPSRKQTPPSAPSAPAFTGGSAAARLEILARVPRTLGRAHRQFWRINRRRGRLEQIWLNRLAKGHETPAWVNVPTGILASALLLTVTVVLPVLGVDLFGTAAAFMPSKKELNGDWGVRAIAICVGGLLAMGAFAGGVVIASVSYMRGAGRWVAVTAALVLAVAFEFGVYQLSQDRVHGLYAQQLLHQVRELDDKIDEVDAEIAKVRADARRGEQGSARPDGLDELEQRRERLEAEQRRLQNQALAAKTTNSLSWLQAAGFLAALATGVYWELGAMLRLEGRIQRARQWTRGAYSRLEARTYALVGVVLLDAAKPAKDAQEVIPHEGEHALADAVMRRLADKPDFTDLDELAREARERRSDLSADTTKEVH